MINIDFHMWCSIFVHSHAFTLLLRSNRTRSLHLIFWLHLENTVDK